jgi:integrase
VSARGSYLIRRGRWFYFRIHIPHDLRKWFSPRHELKISLKTAKYNAAKGLSRLHLGRTEAIFAKIRSGLMNGEEIRKLVAAYFERTADETEDFIRLTEYDEDGEHGVRSLDVLELHLSDLVEHLAKREHGVAAHIADIILEEAGLAVEKTSSDYQKLCREALKGAIAATRIELEHMRGDYSSSLVPAPVATPAAATPDKSEAASAGEPLSKLVEEYKQECIAGKKWGAGTQVEAKGVLGLFLRIMGGDRGIRTLDRRALADFRDTLRRWPQHSSKKPEYRGKSVEEILALGTDTPLGVTSVNKHLTYAGAFIKWAVRNDYMEKNFAEGLSISTRNTSEDEERAAFDVDDLRRLLSSPIYTTALPVDRQERYFVPLIAMLSGMRAGEICQLHVEDVREVEGIPVFDVNSKGERQLKNASSARLVPVHPILVELGLLRYVEKMRDAGEPRLWPRLQKKRGSFGQDFSRWFGRWNREHVTKDRLKVFHSFRHSFETALKRAHVPVAVMAELTGHSHGSIDMDRYGKGFAVTQLLEAVEKVSYGIEEELRKLPRLD